MQAVASMTLQRLGRYTDVALPAGVLGVLLIMVLPLPTWLMDILLATNITVGILILLTSLYVLKPLDFSVFPSMLLLTTLFRLALNVATTRLILLHGNEGTTAAGHVINGFGQFVVGGNMVVGLVIFLILVLINFVVITKGSTRIAEVAARFTLDAMPGKQMAIDADLNAGLIDEDTARKRRTGVEREAEFFGAMDGASKFVRGDAVAGLIITAINLIGGLLIGVMQQGMDLHSAMETYSILTVGDGLVSQIPALVISTAAGIIITRAGGGATLSDELGTQFSQSPRIYLVASAALLLISIVPGLPLLPFLLLAAGTGAFGWYRRSEEHSAASTEAQPETIPQQAAPSAPVLRDLVAVDPFRLEVGYGLIDLVESKRDGDLLDRLQAMRRQIAQEIGFVLPPVHIKDNLQLGVGDYRVYIRGAEIGRGEIRPRQLLALGADHAAAKLEGIPTEEPAFGMPALWVSPAKRQQAEMAGYTVVDPSTVIVTHISELLHHHAHEIMDRGMVRDMLGALSERHPQLVDELVPSIVPLGLLQQVLKQLLAEWVPIRDLLLILETLADISGSQQGVEALTERVRARLGRSIVQSYLNAKGELHVLTISPQVETAIGERLRSQPDLQLPLEMTQWQRLLAQMSEQIARHEIDPPIVLTTPRLRPLLARALMQNMRRIVVLSVAEVPGNVMVKNISSIGLDHAA